MEETEGPHGEGTIEFRPEESARMTHVVSEQGHRRQREPGKVQKPFQWWCPAC